MQVISLVRALGGDTDSENFGIAVGRNFVTYRSGTSAVGRLPDGSLLTYQKLRWAMKVIVAWAEAYRSGQKLNVPSEAFYMQRRRKRD